MTRWNGESSCPSTGCAETRSRPAPRAAAGGESLDEHLAEEVPDIKPDQPRSRIYNLDETPDDLDETTDERAADEEDL
ncbi:hypothetical protein [Saccharopolyspora spinosa]|uniref:Uncharacterized protein n=1 Tax=Saccharopolyspora spinosa TaxID=60894 RepID=A0A2N3Y4J8_SACSN|nr:hypothetical protein [Saccharopolyspora spinosa]PKW17840.1 hypothetical protein A8926_5861 [Saccharopolyspora spinosa]